MTNTKYKSPKVRVCPKLCLILYHIKNCVTCVCLMLKLNVDCMFPHSIHGSYVMLRCQLIYIIDITLYCVKDKSVFKRFQITYSNCAQYINEKICECWHDCKLPL